MLCFLTMLQFSHISTPLSMIISAVSKGVKLIFYLNPKKFPLTLCRKNAKLYTIGQILPN